MRITHAIRSDGWAGVERHVVTLARAQDRAGHRVEMIGGDPQQARRWLHGSAVQHVPARTVLEVVRALGRTEAPDVLHVHMTAAEVAAALSVRTRRVPVVSTRHFAERRGSSLLTRPGALLAQRRVDAQIAVSRFVADHVEGESTVVLAGVEPRPDGRAAADRERVVLVVQRLQPEKKTHLALHAFAASGLPASGWRLRIAGSGPLHAALADLGRRLGIGESVELLGRRSDVAQLMESAGILVATRDDEAYGLTVVEAMAAGLPVVAAGAGGHLETVGRVEGAALFDPGSVPEAAKLLEALAADEGLRDGYGRVLQRFQRENLTPAAQAEATEAVYRRVL